MSPSSHSSVPRVRPRWVGVVLQAVAAAVLCAGCAFAWARGEPVEPITVIVDNSLDDPVLVRIHGGRVGEAKATGRTFLSVGRTHVAGRRVTVCVDLRASSRARCHPGYLLIPVRVEEIWISVTRGGRVHASVL